MKAESWVRIFRKGAAFLFVVLLLAVTGRALADSATPVATAAATPAAAPSSLQGFMNYADFTWVNGNTREHDFPLDGKFFSPELLFDTITPTISPIRKTTQSVGPLAWSIQARWTSNTLASGVISISRLGSGGLRESPDHDGIRQLRRQTPSAMTNPGQGRLDMSFRGFNTLLKPTAASHRHTRNGWDQYRHGPVPLLRRAFQLLRLGKLVLPGFVRFLKYALVLHGNAHPVFPQ